MAGSDNVPSFGTIIIDDPETGRRLKHLERAVGISPGIGRNVELHHSCWECDPGCYLLSETPREKLLCPLGSAPVVLLNAPKDIRKHVVAGIRGILHIPVVGLGAVAGIVDHAHEMIRDVRGAGIAFAAHRCLPSAVPTAVASRVVLPVGVSRVLY